MEINVYNLQKNYEEFKDLTYDQLMKIGELCLKYYNDGQKGTYDNINEDLQSEVDELTNQVEDLESKNRQLESDIQNERIIRQQEQQKIHIRF